MKYINEFRDPESAQHLINAITQIVTKEWTIMEVCGGQTHSIVHFGIDQLLPSSVHLVHGPGCPVCVTPIDTIDKARAIAQTPNVIFCSFGDMLRVPGTSGDLLSAKAEGADIRIVYSPLDAVDIAYKNRKHQVVFFAVGFETTAPANGFAIIRASQLELSNFSVLVSHVLVPPAMQALLETSGSRVQAFLAAGHVCTIMGWEEYIPICARYKVPIVITGFEPLDLLHGIFLALRQLEQGTCFLENQYARVVRSSGNESARRVMEEVFEIYTKEWRGIGEISQSGLRLRRMYDEFDAEKRFSANLKGEDKFKMDAKWSCLSGEILQGLKKPTECPEFGVRCTPEKPLGATMVSSEGACSAYYRYRFDGG